MFIFAFYNIVRRKIADLKEPLIKPMKISIHPNFRNGGAERSLLNAQYGQIITYGKFIDRQFADQFDNVIICDNRRQVFRHLARLIFNSKPADTHNEIITNQLSAAYFWLLAMLPRVSVTHHQRLSLHGELFLTSNKAKKILIYLAFKLSPAICRIKVPSKALLNDFSFFRAGVSYQKNIIVFPNAPALHQTDKQGIVIVARDAPEKRLCETLSLLDDIAPTGTQVTLIGCTTEFECENLRLTSCGALDDREAYFKEISKYKLGILFSEAEGFGNVIPEFIFAGVWPVVNQCKWGPAETIDDFGVGTILNWHWGDTYQHIVDESRIITGLLTDRLDISDDIRLQVRNEFARA